MNDFVQNFPTGEGTQTHHVTQIRRKTPAKRLDLCSFKWSTMGENQHFNEFKPYYKHIYIYIYVCMYVYIYNTASQKEIETIRKV